MEDASHTPVKESYTPIEILNFSPRTLNALINAAITSPEIHDRLINEFALAAKPLTLEQCAAQDREERAKWAEYVKIARIEAQ